MIFSFVLYSDSSYKICSRSLCSPKVHVHEKVTHKLLVIDY